MDGDLPALGAETQVLLMPATSRDAAALYKLLTASNMSCLVCRDTHLLAESIGPTAGAVIIAEEHLSSAAAPLIAALQAQPVWSDLPVIVLSRSGTESPKLSAVLPLLGNASVLERPVRMSTLLTIIRSALRARQRQYEVRAHLAAMAESERRRRDLLDAERQARNEAERASRMKDEFLATLSHELRTPLNAILGWSQILQISADTLPPEIAEGLGVIDRNARVQTQIIQDLLDMSRIISGKVLLDLHPTNLANMLRAAIETVQPAAKAKQVHLTADLDGQSTTLLVDANRLQQVFWNLLNNAVKFTPAGGEVGITVAPSAHCVRIHVTDTGAGISPEFLPYMFDRFRQADASTTRRHGGLGLGLSIVRQLVELHGGTVSARSDGFGRGSTFTVTLPLEPEAQPTSDEVPSEHGVNNPSAGKSGSLAGLRILVVDDEPDARNFVSRLLENAEATVNTAGNVGEALHALAEHRPDVLISDIGMPVEDGYDLIRKVRKLPPEAGGRTPAIALTAYARTQDTDQIMAAGFQTHLVKPVELSALTAALLRLKFGDIG